MIFLVASCLLAFAGVIAWQAFSADKDRVAFAREREEWGKERRELLTRIQLPEAAPFLFEADDKDGENDLPVLPKAEFDPIEVDKAREHLEEVGYQDGPVA